MTDTIKKGIAALVAGVAAFFAAINVLPAEYNTPEVIASVTSAISVVATFFFGNKDKKETE